MNVIDHIYIGILPQTAHITINRFFSTFVQHQQRAHENAFPRSRTTPHIMSVLWDRATAQPELRIALNNLNPYNNVKLYSLMSKAWERIKLAFLQRARNIHTIVEARVYNRARPGKRAHFARPARPPIPEPCGPTLVQTILYAHLIRLPIAQPHAHPPLSQVSTPIHC